jgi:hypothetical protein
MEMSMTKHENDDNYIREISYIREIFAHLEAAGLLLKTGEFRPNRLGMLEPVYASAAALGLITEEEEQRRLQALDGETDG